MFCGFVPTARLDFTAAPIALISIIFFSILAVAAIAAQELLLCFHILRCTRYHSLRLLHCSIHGVSYHSRNGDASIVCSVAQARLSFHIPTPFDPHFCKVEFFNIAYCGPWASGSCSNLTASVRLPLADHTWCKGRIVDLRLTVRNSENIPDAIVRLREHLLRTVLLGKVQRLDNFVSAADTRLLWSGEGLGVVAEARGYEVVISRRMYEFGRLKGSLVRLWDSDEGRFFLESQNVFWYKAGETRKIDDQSRPTFFDVVCYPWTMASSLITALNDPSSLLDLEVVHGEIRFHKFRDRDHALEKHAMQFFGERKPHWLDTSFLREFMWDTISRALAETHGASSPVGMARQ